MEIAFGCGAVTGFIAASLLWAGIASCEPNREKEAIEKGYARYNPKTGDWEWIEKDNQNAQNSSV